MSSSGEVLSSLLNNLESDLLLFHGKVDPPEHVFNLEFVHQVRLSSRRVLLRILEKDELLLEQCDLFVLVFTAARGIVQLLSLRLGCFLLALHGLGELGLDDGQQQVKKEEGAHEDNQQEVHWDPGSHCLNLPSQV